MVSVEATIAPETSFVPSLAADASVSMASAVVFSLAVALSLPAIFNFLWRSMFSSTTMLLSTNNPTASAIPPKLIMFKLISLAYIRLKVAITDTGIETEIITVAQKSLRKRYSTNMAKIPPITAADFTLSIACLMNTLWS